MALCMRSGPTANFKFTHMVNGTSGLRPQRSESASQSSSRFITFSFLILHLSGALSWLGCSPYWKAARAQAQVMERHTFTAFNTTFVVDSEYEFVKELGQGTYGSVIAVKHKCTGKKCAIKKIPNVDTRVSVCYFAHSSPELGNALMRA